VASDKVLSTCRFDPSDHTPLTVSTLDTPEIVDSIRFPRQGRLSLNSLLLLHPGLALSLFLVSANDLENLDSQ